MSMVKPSPVAGAKRPAKARAGPRKPSRGLGVVRFNALVEATEQLLGEYSPDDVGLYQIAEAAGAPTASVYHFFPTKEAAFLALAERYLQGFIALGEEPIEAASLQSWQDLFALDHRRAMEFYNSHPPALKIFYGGYGSLQTRQADIRFTAGIAGSLYRRMDAAFHMPFLRDAGMNFHIALAIMDAIWAISYQQHDEITEAFYKESLEACMAYCRLFLPERVEPREFCLQAAARGERISLPLLSES